MGLWSAFLIGLVGSVHCAGMCGPLVLALPTTGNSRAAYLTGRAIYNLGRIASYCLLGAVFGLLGKSLALAGAQRWASLGAGIAILAALAASSRYGLGWPATKAVAWLKASFSSLLRKRSLPALFLLGILNGMLPCGLVYVAGTSAVALGGLTSAIVYMFAFGLGTLPMMLGLGLAGKNLQSALRFRFQKLIPLCLVMLAALLIFRGLSLGIPFLSPDLSGGRSCH